MNEQRRSGHTVTRFTAHLVWVTKNRYPVLKGDIQLRCRKLIIQICDEEDVQILKGVVSKDHTHMHIKYSSRVSISDLPKLVERTYIANTPERISSLKENATGNGILGNRLRCLVNGQRH